MAEESLFPFRSFFALLNVAALGVVIIVFIWLFVRITVDIEESELERTIYLMREAVVKSSLTYDIAVFNRDVLNNHIGDKGDPYNANREEPYPRHCSYAYRAVIEDLITDEIWEIGYDDIAKLSSYAAVSDPVSGDTTGIIDSDTIESPVSVYDSSSDSVNPAKLTLTLYDTWLTRITCMAEKAYISGKILQIETKRCNFLITEKDGDMCYAGGAVPEANREDPAECRHMYTPLVPFDCLTGNKETLKIVPIKRSNVMMLPNPTTDCNDIYTAWVASPEDVGTVVICYGELNPDTPPSVAYSYTFTATDPYHCECSGSHTPRCGDMCNKYCKEVRLADFGVLSGCKITSDDDPHQCTCYYDNIPENTQYIEEIKLPDNTCECDKSVLYNNDGTVNLDSNCEQHCYDECRAAGYNFGTISSCGYAGGEWDAVWCSCWNTDRIINENQLLVYDSCSCDFNNNAQPHCGEFCEKRCLENGYLFGVVAGRTIEDNSDCPGLDKVSCFCMR